MGSFPSRFSFTSEPESQPRPPYIKQLNDSVYELYKPAASIVPSVEVIFFHGLEQDQDYKEAFWKTWLSRDGKVVWPKAWLSRDLPGARMLLISYNSAAQRESGQIDNYLIVENLIGDIICDRKAGQNCPVILVGHCLGGLIIKEFVLGCKRYIGVSRKDKGAQWNVNLIENFLSNWKGVFYYGTPHSGSRIADYLVKVKGRGRLNEQVIQLLSLLNAHTSRINTDFAKAQIGEDIRSEAVAEALKTKYMDFEGILVEEASARHDVKELYTVPDANHFQLCKAKNAEWCSIYNKLYNFIERILKDSGNRTNAEGNATTSEEKPGIKLLQSLNL